MSTTALQCSEDAELKSQLLTENVIYYAVLDATLYSEDKIDK